MEVEVPAEENTYNLILTMNQYVNIITSSPCLWALISLSRFAALATYKINLQSSYCVLYWEVVLFSEVTSYYDYKLIIICLEVTSFVGRCPFHTVSFMRGSCTKNFIMLFYLDLFSIVMSRDFTSIYIDVHGNEVIDKVRGTSTFIVRPLIN